MKIKSNLKNLNFRKIVEDELASKEIPKAQFAKTLGISRQSLGAVLKRNSPSISTMKEWFDMLGMDISVYSKDEEA